MKHKIMYQQVRQKCHNSNFLFSYAKKKGMMSWSSYSYTGRDGSCKYKRWKIAATVKSYNDAQQNSESALQTAVANNGPVSVAVDAERSMQNYGGGIYSGNDCSSNCNSINHAVTVVGYAPGYWIVKNSWGTGWGENGYIRMATGRNMCGINCYGEYPIS